MRRHLRARRARSLAVGLTLAATLAATLTACGSASGDTEVGAAPAEVRLGYFANITHGPALVGLDKGYFAESLGAETKLTTTVFNAGPAAIEALFSDALDITYIGPSPAINGYVQSAGTGVRVVAGSTSGGASFVVKPEITSTATLRGKRVATPQLGNTQDVALRWWAEENGLATSETGEGDFVITPQKNSQTVTQFQQGQIDGAWVPEPFASKMVIDGGGSVLVDERSEWPDGQFATTVVLVRQEFLEKNPATVKKILEAHVRSLGYIRSDPLGAQQAINAQLVAISGEGLSQAVLDRAWGQIDFTPDPLASTIVAAADHAVAVGQQDRAAIDAAGGIAGLVDVTLLNEVLVDSDLPEVTV